MARRRARPADLEDEPVPPPSKENWLAAGAHVVAGVLGLLSFPIVHEMALFGALSGAGLALGSWVVRPAPRKGRLFRLLMLPIVLQAAAYLLYWYPVASAALTGRDEAEFLDSVGQHASFQAALAALILGWIPAMALFRVARHGLILVAVQVASPGAAVVFFIMSRLGF